MDDLYRLRKVLQRLDSYGVVWWIDHGTLLGVIRERRLLPWDNDVDISIRAVDFGRAVAALGNLDADDQCIVVRTARSLKVWPENPAAKEIDVNCYHPMTGGELVKRLVMFPRGNDVRGLRARVAAWRRLRKVERLCRRVHKSVRIQRWRVGPRIRVANQWFCSAVASLRERCGICLESRVPQVFFGEFSEIYWRGLTLRVPTNYEEYLQFRYGASWRVPVKKWAWWKKDETIAANQ